MAFEDVLANYEAARKGQGMLRSDYYGNEFAIQNQLDAALMQKEAERIVNDPDLLAAFLKESGMSTDSMPSQGKTDRSPLSIGIGARTDEIKEDAVIAAIRGLLTGGLGSALTGGVKSYLGDVFQTLSDVNASSDPIATLNSLQRWTKAPVESRTGQTPAEIAQADWARAVNEQAASRMARQAGVGGGSDGNAPGASPGEVGNRDFAGQVGYDQ